MNKEFLTASGAVVDPATLKEIMDAVRELDRQEDDAHIAALATRRIGVQMPLIRDELKALNARLELAQVIALRIATALELMALEAMEVPAVATPAAQKMIRMYIPEPPKD